MWKMINVCDLLRALITEPISLVATGPCHDNRGKNLQEHHYKQVSRNREKHMKKHASKPSKTQQNAYSPNTSYSFSFTSI